MAIRTINYVVKEIISVTLVAVILKKYTFETYIDYS